MKIPVEDKASPWRKWGAYVSERSWGSVREDYSQDGDAWNYVTHDMARSKAYRWGEDGIAGFCDYFQTFVLSFAFWNGKDPILKERLFGLNPYEGNHGEDVKECYYYLDATPTQSYMKFLYKYPQRQFPYDELVSVNKKRTTFDREYEIQDTDAFKDERYFDVFIEYAKNEVDDICIRVQVWNRGPEKAVFHLLPQLAFRNRWSWGDSLGPIPEIKESQEGVLMADPCGTPRPLRATFLYECPIMYLYGKSPKKTLFTNNETNNEKIWATTSRTRYVKDAFHRHIINNEDCVCPEKKGSKACFHYEEEIAPQDCSTFLLRLSSKKLADPLADVESCVALRKQEADEFYQAIQLPSLSSEEKAVQRTAWAGMLWSQQVYIYNVRKWLEGDNHFSPPPPGRAEIRNTHWENLYACDVISMPDKWEYPWFASWDLAFHAVSLSLVDINLAKEQLQLLLRHWYQHVNGQIPAYEWNFSDLNPPVQAWACWKIYQQEEETTGEGDHDFLLFCFLRLVQNFDWWVNKVDKFGNNFFEGGFLGLDNISVIDRSQPLADGKVIEQSDATGWMGLYALVMMRIALELAKTDGQYGGIATNFFEHFIYISSNIHETHDMWDEKDGFFYDVIASDTGSSLPLKLRSFVGVIPFYSFISIDTEELCSHKEFCMRLEQFRESNQARVDRCLFKIGKRTILSLMNVKQMEKVLTRCFDPDEFFSSYGLRSVSKYHEKNPFIFEGITVGYEPAESIERIKGGNSNWRGPIWIPTNYLFLDALHKLLHCVGDDFRIECQGEEKKIGYLLDLLQERLSNLFLKNSEGFRPIHGDCLLYQKDPYWKDLILFYEHYHGDIGRGLGASHQTGWSGLIANIIDHIGKRRKEPS